MSAIILIVLLMGLIAALVFLFSAHPFTFEGKGEIALQIKDRKSFLQLFYRLEKWRNFNCGFFILAYIQIKKALGTCYVGTSFCRHISSLQPLNRSEPYLEV